MVPEFPTHPYGRVCCSISLAVHVPTIFNFEDVDVVVVLPEQHELRRSEVGICRGPNRFLFVFSVPNKIVLRFQSKSFGGVMNSWIEAVPL
jgi:hypothetical protein